MTNRRAFLTGAFLALTLLCAPVALNAASAEAPYRRVVVLSDPHLPIRAGKYPAPETQTKILKAKDRVIEDLNAADDIAEIIVTGDIAANYGTPEEWQKAKSYFAPLKPPVRVLAGNHDYIYRDKPDAAGNALRNNPRERAAKLEAFRRFWGLEAVSRTETLAGYRLFLLSPESLESYSVGMSPGQLEWFARELARSSQPTVVFFHAPLKGTTGATKDKPESANSVAQPAEAIEAILKANPQVFVWVAGHKHMSPKDPGFADAKANLFDGRVHVVNCPALDKKTVLSTSLYLYPDRILVRTFNHTKGRWEAAFDRTFPVPAGLSR